MIDIIITVYNTPIKDLKRCLDSIMNQIYINFKVIIIDDGSNEQIANFLDNYVGKDKKFVIKHIKNGGVSKARNLAISISDSKYICFLDSDDTIEKDFISKYIKVIEEEKLDYIVGGWNIIHKDKTIVKTIDSIPLKIYDKRNINNVKAKVLSGKVDNKNYELRNVYLARIHGKIYKRDLIKKVCFDESLPLSEDSLFSIDLMKYIEKIGIAQDIFYNYYQNEYSVLHKKNNIKDIMDLYKFYERLLSREKEINILDLKKAINLRMISVKIIILKKLLMIKDKKIANNFIKQNYKKERYKIKEFKEYRLNFSEKILILFFKLPVSIQLIVFNIVRCFIKKR